MNPVALQTICYLHRRQLVHIRGVGDAVCDARRVQVPQLEKLLNCGAVSCIQLRPRTTSVASFSIRRPPTGTWSPPVLFFHTQAAFQLIQHRRDHLLCSCFRCESSRAPAFSSCGALAQGLLRRASCLHHNWDVAVSIGRHSTGDGVPRAAFPRLGFMPSDGGVPNEHLRTRMMRKLVGRSCLPNAFN